MGDLRLKSEGDEEECQLWIGGKARRGNGERIEVEDPSIGEAFAYFHSASAQDVDDAVEAAHAAYKSGVWSRAPRHHRADVLDAIAAQLQSHLRSLIDLEVRQTGRAVRELNAQVPSLVRWFKYYASVLRTEERPLLPTQGKLHNWVERVPIGVAAQIAPFNHPLLIATKKLAPALAAGNSVVLKPSELTPLTACRLGPLLKDAGLPDGVFNVVLGDGRTVGAALVAHPRVGKVDVTGSTAAGRAIGAVAGQNLASFTAELGGKAPVLVFETADPDAAANGIAFGAFVASGQTCVAATRILVQRPILAGIVGRLRNKCESIILRTGSPTNPASAMGPLISRRQLEGVEALVRDALDLSARSGIDVVAGGGRMSGPSPLDGHDLGRGYYFAPTVLVDSSRDAHDLLAARIWREEAFGPVIVVVPFDTEEEALRLANDSEFGLGAGIWTQDLSQAFRVSEGIEAGITWVNTHHRNDPSSPWGGFGSSGVGSENGIEAYRAYTKMKSTIINYASIEESLASEDWFGEEKKDVRYG